MGNQSIDRFPFAESANKDWSNIFKRQYKFDWAIAFLVFISGDITFFVIGYWVAKLF